MKKLVLIACVLVGVGFGADIKTLTQQCEAKDGEACFDISNKYYKAKNYSKSFEFAQKACDLKNAGGCVLMGALYSGESSGKRERSRRRICTGSSMGNPWRTGTASGENVRTSDI